MSNDVTKTRRTWLVSWIGIVRRMALAVLVLALASAAGSLWYAVDNFSINTSTEDMLSDDLPFKQDKKILDEAFPDDGGRALLIVVDAPSPDQAQDAASALADRLAEEQDIFFKVTYTNGHPFFRQNGLLYLDIDELADLSIDLARVQPLLTGLWQDMSLRGLFEVLEIAAENAEGNEAAAVAPALDRLSAAVESTAEGELAIVSWQELMSGEDADAEDLRQYVIATARPDYDILTPGKTEMRAARKAAVELGLTEENGYQIRLTGNMAMRYEEFKTLEDGMIVISLVTLALVTLILAVGLKSIRLMGGTIVTLIVGLSWTAFFAMFAIGQLNIISVAFAVLFIGLSVDFGIHITLRFREGLDSGKEIAEALADAAQGLAWPLLLCAISTAIGFYAFLPTAYKGVSELGLIAGTGILFALFANLTVLPALLTLLRPRGSSDRLSAVAGARAQGFVTRNARPVVFGAIAVAIASLFTLPFAAFDHDPLNLRDPDTESVSTMLDLMRSDQAQRFDITILAPDLDTAAELDGVLEALPEVDKARTLVDLVPQEQDEKLYMIEEMTYFLAPLLLPRNGPAPASDEDTRDLIRELVSDLRIAEGSPAFQAGARRLADALEAFLSSGESLEALDRALLSTLPNRLLTIRAALDAEPVTLASLPVDIMSRMLATDGRAKIKVYPVEDMRDRDRQRDFVAAVRTVAPRAAGTVVTLLESGNAVVSAFKEAGIYAVVLIMVILLVLLRSVRDTALVLAPLLLAALLTVAATVVVGMPFNYANVIALPLILGMGVDSGIHLVMRRREEGRTGRGLLETSTPRAVLLSALTTICSFGALSLSTHLGTASMGMLLTMAIVMTLLCTLVVLPALMAWVDGPRPAEGAEGEERAAAQ